MEYKGIEYSMVQTAAPSGWKWTVTLPGRQPVTGQAYNREEAIRFAKFAIDGANKVKRSKPEEQ